VKSSKAQIMAKFHKIPVIRFEDQQLTSFSGLLIFQQLFKRTSLKKRLKKCFAHLKVSPIFGRHLVVMLLIVHLLLGFRRLREVDYYRDDPIVLRLMGLHKLPDVATISRALLYWSSKNGHFFSSSFQKFFSFKFHRAFIAQGGVQPVRIIKSNVFQGLIFGIFPGGKLA